MAQLILAIPICSLMVGIFLLRRPESAIEIQRRFYAKINWKIEPISMGMEIRNTRLMGLFLIILSLSVATYLIAKSKFG
jgi:hypothetical protein